MLVYKVKNAELNKVLFYNIGGDLPADKQFHFTMEELTVILLVLGNTPSVRAMVVSSFKH